MTQDTAKTTGQASADLRDTAEHVQQGIRDMGSQLRDAAGEQYRNLRDQAADYYEQGRDRAKEWEASLEQYVQDKPIQALLIAAGAGMLLGLLWKRS